MLVVRGRLRRLRLALLRALAARRHLGVWGCPQPTIETRRTVPAAGAALPGLPVRGTIARQPPRSFVAPCSAFTTSAKPTALRTTPYFWEDGKDRPLRLFCDSLRRPSRGVLARVEFLW